MNQTTNQIRRGQNRTKFLAAGLAVLMGGTTLASDSVTNPVSTSQVVVCAFNYYYIVRTIGLDRFQEIVNLASTKPFAPWHNASTSWHGSLLTSWYGEKKQEASGGAPLKLGIEVIQGQPGKTAPAALFLVQEWGETGPMREVRDKYYAICRAAGTKVVLALGVQNLAWNPRTVPLQVYNHKSREEALAQFERTYQRYEQQLIKNIKAAGVHAIPLHRAFKVFYDTNPTLELNHPLGDRNHLGPLSSYLIACTFAATLGDKRPSDTAFPAKAVLFQDYDKQRAKERERNPEAWPELTFDSLQPLIHEAVWTAVGQWRKEAGDSRP